MASHYVHEYDRKHAYKTRAVTYPVQRMSDNKTLEFRSIAKMCEELDLSDFKVRQFYRSKKESTYIRNKSKDKLYFLKRPIKDIAITARLAEEDYDTGAPERQEFTSLYQLVKRFRVSNSTVAELRAMQPKGIECKKTIYNEFKVRYYLTFYK